MRYVLFYLAVNDLSTSFLSSPQLVPLSHETGKLLLTYVVTKFYAAYKDFYSFNLEQKSQHVMALASLYFSGTFCTRQLKL